MNSNLFRSVVSQVRRKNKDAPNLGHPSKVQNQAVRDLVVSDRLSAFSLFVCDDSLPSSLAPSLPDDVRLADSPTCLR
jgi:hypothetical protein